MRPNPDRDRRILKLHRGGNLTAAELAAMFGVSKQTIYNTIQRAKKQEANP